MLPATLLVAGGGVTAVASSATPRRAASPRLHRRNNRHATASSSCYSYQYEYQYDTAPVSGRPASQLRGGTPPSEPGRLRGRRGSALMALQQESGSQDGVAVEPLSFDAEGPALAAGEGTSTFNQALFNSINILMGVGLLSVPYALKEGGWTALGVLGLLGLTTNYTGKLIVRCQESVCDECTDPYVEPRSGGERGECRPVSTYEGIGQLAFGDWGRRFITLVLYTELLGTCGLFFILEGDHLALLLGDLTGWDSNQLMFASSALILPTTWLADLSALSYVGLLGGASSLLLTGVVAGEFLQQSGLADPHVRLEMTQLADTTLLHASQLPVTFGLLAFVFAGHAVFPGIYTSMREKERFPEMLDLTYLIVGATCLVVGVSGYLLYGEQTMEEVTMNLDDTSAAANLATALILISPFTKFALTLDPVARGVEEKLGIDVGGEGALKARLLRTGLGLGTLGMAAALPFFAALMALIGSFLTLVVSVIFPSLSYLAIYGGRVSDSERMLNYGVVALGTFCAAAGTWTAFQEISASM
eukprot:jgi/Tetstr1/425264/TSEL_015717.t1